MFKTKDLYSVMLQHCKHIGFFFTKQKYLTFICVFFPNNERFNLF